MAHRKAFLRMPDMEESEAVFLRKGPKSGFGPDFYFGPCGLEGQSDRTKHSAVIFQPRVAGTTHPPAPARHPPPATFLEVLDGSLITTHHHPWAGVGSIPTQPLGPHVVPLIPSGHHTGRVRPYYREYT